MVPVSEPPKKVVPVFEPEKRSCQYLMITLKVVPLYDVNHIPYLHSSHTFSLDFEASFLRNRRNLFSEMMCKKELDGEC